MRAVAKFQLTTSSTGQEVSDQVVSVVSRWAERKFEKRSDGNYFIRRSGVEATANVHWETVGDRHLKTYVFVEPIEGGFLETKAQVLTDLSRTVFRCTLSVGSDVGVAPSTVSLYPPRFIRDIVALSVPWTFGLGGERAFAQCFLADADNLDDLLTLMSEPNRRLPIVIVSELDGETLSGDLHDRLSVDLCGLAHTVRLSVEGSWGLTSERGKEWSCYNGAVRLFWPFRLNESNPRFHPLWTLDQLQIQASDTIQARDRLRENILIRIMEASTFVPDDPAFHEMEVLKARTKADELRAVAASDGDLSALAESYAIENDDLRALVDTQEQELENLRDNVRALTVALRASQTPAVHQLTESPPQTVSEAVATARQQTNSNLSIATETDADVKELNSAAGPPDKLLRYLKTLGSLGDALAIGPLGKSVPIWLRERGVECSGDSETAKTSKDGKRNRTRVVNGETVNCEFHAKPSDHIAPDMCIRIFFAICSSAPFVKIGYIGRHHE